MGEERPAFLVRLCRRHNCDIEPVDRFDLVELDLREYHLLLDPDGIFPLPSKDFTGTPLKSLMRGSAALINRSRNSYIRSHLRVTEQPIGMPS